MTWSVVTCDILRDGGSYEATLRRGDEVCTLFLQVNAWERPGEQDWLDLYVFPGQEFAPADVAGHASTRTEEQGWTEALLAARRDHLRERGATRLDELLAILTRRERRATPQR